MGILNKRNQSTLKALLYYAMELVLRDAPNVAQVVTTSNTGRHVCRYTIRPHLKKGELHPTICKSPCTDIAREFTAKKNMS